MRGRAVTSFTYYPPKEPPIVGQRAYQLRVTVLDDFLIVLKNQASNLSTFSAGLITPIGKDWIQVVVTERGASHYPDSELNIVEKVKALNDPFIPNQLL